ncbi:alpha/beta fold hydrolase [Sphingomonas sp. YL-JM2C]
MTTAVLNRTRTNPAIAYERKGAGDLVLFVHGLGADRRAWRAQLDGLSHAYHACAIDLRGYHDSGDPAEPVSMDDFVADVLAVLDDLGVARAHLVGQSMGGLVLQHLHMRAPDRIRSLTLANTTRSLRASMTDDQLEEFMRNRRDLIATGISMTELARTMAGAVVAPQADDAVFEAVREGFAALRPGYYLAAMEMVVRYCPVADLTSIAVPVLVVSGRYDRLTPPAAGRELAAAIPGARYVEIEDAGHMSNMERPDRFNTALLDFLAATEGR